MARGLDAAAACWHTESSPEEGGQYMSTFVIQPHVRLQEWVAEELVVTSGAFEDMSAGRTCDVSSACHWAVNAAAATRHGRMYGHAYSLSPAGIFVAPESPCHKPEDLAGVEVGVGFHSGSHYSAIQALEPFLQRDQITLRFVGTPHDRVRLLLGRTIPAVNIF